MSDMVNALLEDDAAPELYKGWATQYQSIRGVVTKADESVQDSDTADKFLAEELAMASVLGYALSKKSGAFISEYLEELDREDLDRAYSRMVKAQNEFDEIFDEDVEAAVRRSLDTEMFEGAARASAVEVFRSLESRSSILDGMVKSTKYYTNNYFNRFVVPELQDAVERQFITGSGGTEAFRAVQDLLNKRLKSVPYWRVVANAGASRSYHYGMLKSGAMTGYRGYVLDAVMDEKTSKTCRMLDGREFWVADAVQLIERTALATSVEEVKDLQPWLSYKDIAELSTADLATKGVMVPPFHGNCRTTLRLISGF